MIPVTVLTGFLGSGKTTLLAAMLRRPAFAGAAVIMNEFGEIGLDHHLIETSEEDLITLATGCICCQARGDLVRAADDLLARRAAGGIAFDRIVIETTGMADPAPILQGMMLDPGLADRTRLAGVVTTVDAAIGAETLDARLEARRQAAFADRIVVTKADIAGPAAADALAARLRALNPTAEISVANFGDIDPALLTGARSARDLDIPAAAHGHGSDGHHHHTDGGVAAVLVRRNTPTPAAALPLFLEAMAETYGPKLLRLKGIVGVAEAPDRPAVLHGVRHVVHPPVWLDAWPDADRSTRLVLIGEDIAPEWPGLLLDLLSEEAVRAAD